LYDSIDVAGKPTLKAIKKNEDWLCYICNQEDLWKLRHITHAACVAAQSNQKKLRAKRLKNLAEDKKKKQDEGRQ